jgi:hypothetical protein
VAALVFAGAEDVQQIFALLVVRVLGLDAGLNFEVDEFGD